VRYGAPMNKLSSLLLPLLLAACGGNVVVDGSPGASVTGAGGSATTGAGGAVGTSGGAGTSSGSTGVAGSQTGAGGSSTTSCTGTFFQLTVGNQTNMLTASCTSQAPLPVPFGQEFSGGPAVNPGSLTIEGCQSSAANSLQIGLSAADAFAPGMYMVSGAKLFTGQSAVVLSGLLTVDSLGPVGGTITGSFELEQGTFTVEGKFSVCRAPDIDAN